MAENTWLYNELVKKPNLQVDNDFEELILVTTSRGKEYKIYCPDRSEYYVTVDIVQKVAEIGGDIISYPSSWCSCSIEAKGYAERYKIQVMSHGETFGFFDRIY